MDINKKKEAEKEKEAKNKRLEEIENNIRIMESKIQSAEQIIDDENKSLKACVKKMNTQIFIDGQQKVEIGLKRHSKLKAELEVAMKKKKSFAENKN